MKIINDNLKIIFFGTPVFAIPVLQKLIENRYDVVGVFTGHGPLEFEAEKLEIKIFRSKSLKKDEIIFEQFKSLNPDLCVVAAYGKIIPKSYLDIPKYGFVNVHPSLLPKYRGPSPIQTAILNGDIKTGVSIIIVDEEMDHGPILEQKTYNIQPTTNNIMVSKELFELGADLLIEILPKFINKEIKPQEQDHAKATFTKMFSREDGRINWNEPAEKIYNQIRALNPEPGTWTLLRRSVAKAMEHQRQGFHFRSRSYGGQVGGQSKILNIKEVNISRHTLHSTFHTPGTVIRKDNDIAVTTKTCYLILKQIQLEGGKEMDVKSFVNGHPDFLNSKLE